MIRVLISADSRYSVNRGVITAAVEDALKKARAKGKIEVSIAIVGGRAMVQLNKKYRQVDQTTDVLAFPQQEVTPVTKFDQASGGKGKYAGFVKFPDKWLRLGDVVISYPAALESAAAAAISIDEELALLVEYGVNRLLGIHHENS